MFFTPYLLTVIINGRYYAIKSNFGAATNFCPMIVQCGFSFFFFRKATRFYLTKLLYLENLSKLCLYMNF